MVVKEWMGILEQKEQRYIDIYLHTYIFIGSIYNHELLNQQGIDGPTGLPGDMGDMGRRGMQGSEVCITVHTFCLYLHVA